MTDTNSQNTTLMSGILVAAEGAWFTVPRGTTHRTYGAKVVGTGAVTATVKIWGRSGHSGAVLLGTITLSGTTSAADGFASDASWPEVMAEVTAITGTGAAVTAAMGI